ncbi:MAG TPA: type II toxin-antitoxin system VapC family toxin [Candidatus Binataceae bacterium]|jgi:predicted nucleic acid-binding protein|nr:type II toxin-antitoxin system VapC family toxin [Candidatus Binataceae bacterium]
MPAKVVDASVLAAVAFGEPRMDEAAALLLGAELYAPDLLPYEMASIALKKSRLYPARAPQIASALETVMKIDISLVSVAARDLLALATETKLTVYDAAYFHLAQSLNCPLITFDERLAKMTLLS